MIFMQGIDKESLAEKIAKLIAAETQANDLPSIQASLDKINERLDKLEQSSIPNSTLRTPHSEHPSQQHFTIAEAIADAVFAGSEKEKTCTFEPNGRPCDYCSMCSSRGF